MPTYILSTGSQKQVLHCGIVHKQDECKTGGKYVSYIYLSP